MFLISFFLSVSFGLSEPFSFHIPAEPSSLNPSRISGIEANYFYKNIFSGLYKFDDSQGLVPEGARECVVQKLKVICKLNPDLMWSDGSPVESTHYVQAFKYLVDPSNKSREAGILESVKNFKDIVDGSKKPDELAVRSKGPYTLEFDLSFEDPDILYRLTHPVLSPWKVLPDKETSLTNGPYKIKSWSKGNKIILENNPHYYKKHNRPNVEIYFIQEDMTVVNLFESNKLKMIRRIPTNLKKQYESRPGYFTNIVSQFDYIGFGPELSDKPLLRKALSLGLDFESYKKLMAAEDRPGCPGFSPKYLDKRRCLEFNFNQAKSAVAEFTKTKKLPKLELSISISGDDVKLFAEWAQNQWRKLGLNVEIRLVEGGMYRQFLMNSPTAIFRRGVTLDRPTCLAAMEIFKSNHPDNLIRLNSKAFDNILNQFLNPKKNQIHCGQAIQFLLDGNYLIPLGQYSLGGIVNPKFKGWKINELNQLDLTNLHIGKH